MCIIGEEVKKMAAKAIGPEGKGELGKGMRLGWGAKTLLV